MIRASIRMGGQTVVFVGLSAENLLRIRGGQPLDMRRLGPDGEELYQGGPERTIVFFAGDTEADVSALAKRFSREGPSVLLEVIGGMSAEPKLLRDEAVTSGLGAAVEQIARVMGPDMPPSVDAILITGLQYPGEEYDATETQLGIATHISNPVRLGEHVDEPARIAFLIANALKRVFDARPDLMGAVALGIFAPDEARELWLRERRKRSDG